VLEVNKIFIIATKTLKEAMRQPKNLAITLGLPVAFMLIFGLAFGGTEATTYDLAVVNEDAGDLGDAYVIGISGIRYEDDLSIFIVTNYTDAQAARAGLREGDYDALLLIPSNFSQNAVPQGAPPPGSPVPPLTQPQDARPPAAVGAIVEIVGDPTRAGYQASSQILSGYTAAFAEKVSDARPAVATRGESVAASELSGFDYIAPGLMVFAILNMVPQAASVLAREKENKTLDRVRMSPTGAVSLLGGVALAQLVLASVSLALMLVTAQLMGFQNQGSYLSAYVIALAAAVSVTGVGMVIASFARTQQEAVNFGILVSVPASFLSGAFFAIPGVRLFGGVDLYDLLPTTHAVKALRQIMTFGLDVSVVMTSIAALFGLALAYFLIGVLLYRRTRLAPE
jgi:ABC-2 type transport system permease protein